MSQELLGLHNLKGIAKAKKVKVRLGRGNASSGNYSGRGMKGQKSRSGGKGGLKLRGIKAYLLRIPKQRGFRSDKLKNVPINLETINKYFNDGEVVSLKSLARHGLIIKNQKNVKILAKGQLTKKLQVKIDNLSVSAKEAIIKAGGSILDIKNTKRYNIEDAKKDSNANGVNDTNNKDVKKITKDTKDKPAKKEEKEGAKKETKKTK